MHTGKLSIFKKRHHRTIHNTKHKGASQKKIYYSEHLWLRCDMENKGKIMSMSRKFCSVPSPSLYSSRARTWVQQPVSWEGGGGESKRRSFGELGCRFITTPIRGHWIEPCSWQPAHRGFAAFCFNLAKRYMFIKVNFPVSVFNIKKHNQKQPEIPTEMRRSLMWNVCVLTWNWASEKRVGGKKGAWRVHFGKTLCCF